MNDFEEKTLFRTKWVRKDAIPYTYGTPDAFPNSVVRARQAPTEVGPGIMGMPGLAVSDDMAVRNVVRPRRGYGY